jgi:hypothetical protein
MAGVWVIDCTTPLAKSRGICLLGDNGTGLRSRDLVVTNGTVRLSGDHAAPLAIASSYGVVIFDGTASSPRWNAHLSIPVPDTTVVAASPDTGIGAGAEVVDASSPSVYKTGIIERSSASIAVSAKVSANSTFGFTPTATTQNADLFVHYVPGIGVTLWAADDDGIPRQMASMPYADLAPVQVTLRYERAINAAIVSIGANTPERIQLPSGTQPRFETAGVVWDAPVANLTVTANACGSALYSAGTVMSPQINGLVVGSSLTGNLVGLTLNPDETLSLTGLTERLIALNHSF